MEIITTHATIGNHHRGVIEDGLRAMGVQDNSHVQTAVASHIWAYVCGPSPFCWGQDHKKWGSAEVHRAITDCRQRLNEMEASLTAVDAAAGETPRRIYLDKYLSAAMECTKASYPPDNWEFIGKNHRAGTCKCYEHRQDIP